MTQAQPSLQIPLYGFSKAEPPVSTIPLFFFRFSLPPPPPFDPLHHPSPNRFFRSGSICSCPSPTVFSSFSFSLHLKQLHKGQIYHHPDTVQPECVPTSFSRVLDMYSLSLGFQDPNLLFLGQLSIKLRKKTRNPGWESLALGC